MTENSRQDRLASPFSAPQSEIPHSHFVHWIALVLIIAAAVLVRLHCLPCKPFWFDETFSVEVARMDWPNFLRVLWWREANMSLYYFLLRAWLHFGASESFIRSLSVVLAAATIPAIYWLAKLLSDSRIALLAAALFALNAFDVRYSQEARSYALLVLLATLSSAFFIALLRHRRPGLRAGYILFSTLAVYAHLYALLMLAAHWLVLRHRSPPADLLRDQQTKPDQTRQDLQRAFRIIAICVAPLIIFVIKTGAGPIRWIPRPGLASIFEFWRYFTSGTPLIMALACVAALVPIGKRLFHHARDWETWRLQFLAVWLLFPILLTLLLSIVRPVFYPRYMIFCLPPMLILAAIGIFRIRPQWLAAVCICGLLLLSSRMIPFVWAHDVDNDRDGSAAASKFILDNAQPGDGVIFFIPPTRVPYDFFRSIRAGHSVTSNEFGPEVLYPRHGQDLQFLDLKSKLSSDQLRSVVNGHPRIWVMLMYNHDKDPAAVTRIIQQDLALTYPIAQHWDFPQVDVLLYSK